jgi:hypothetical protein
VVRSPRMIFPSVGFTRSSSSVSQGLLHWPQTSLVTRLGPGVDHSRASAFRPAGGV